MLLLRISFTKRPMFIQLVPGLAHGHLEAELGGEELHEALLVQLEGHVVDGGAVAHVDHLRGSDGVA